MLAFDIQLHCAYGDEFDIKLDINIKVDAHSDARDPESLPPPIMN